MRFFFQAEDGIRDYKVTGVQTCALPISITLGATEAIFSAVQAVIGAGDEAIAFDPAYDSYEPAVRLAGGRCVRLPLAQPGFRYDWERARAAVTERTRLVLFNSPHNPA